MKNFLPNLFPQQISKHSLIYFISGSLPLTHLYSQYRNLSLNLKQQTVLKVYKFPSIPSENKKSHSFGYFRIWFVFLWSVWSSIISAATIGCMPRIYLHLLCSTCHSSSISEIGSKFFFSTIPIIANKRAHADGFLACVSPSTGSLSNSHLACYTA